MKFGRLSLMLGLLCAAVSAQATFECYPLGPFPPAGPGNCEGVTSNGLGFGTGVDGTAACGMPAEGLQYARVGANGPHGVTAGGPLAYPVNPVVSEIRIPIPTGAGTIDFCWEFFNSEGGATSTFNDGGSISLVDAAGSLITNFVYVDTFSGLGACFDPFSGGTEAAPNGLVSFSGVLPPLVGGEYVSVACWNGGDNAVASQLVIDNVQFVTGGQICPPPPPPLANDTCATAAAISEGVVTAGTNLTAGTGPDPVAACGGMAADVWYVFVASCTGTYTATTCVAGTGYDTVVAVWDGTNGCGSLVPITCNDDNCNLGAQFLSSSTSWSATAGNIYYVSVGGFVGSMGNFNLLVNPGGGMNLSITNSGPGTIGYQIVGGPPSGTAFTAITLNAGAFPNGWFFGIDIPLQELAIEINFGFPFSVALDTCGNATVGPFGGVPSGLTVYAVSLGTPNGGTTPTTISNAATGTVP